MSIELRVRVERLEAAVERFAAKVDEAYALVQELKRKQRRETPPLPEKDSQDGPDR